MWYLYCCVKWRWLPSSCISSLLSVRGVPYNGPGSRVSGAENASNSNWHKTDNTRLGVSLSCFYKNRSRKKDHFQINEKVWRMRNFCFFATPVSNYHDTLISAILLEAVYCQDVDPFSFYAACDLLQVALYYQFDHVIKITVKFLVRCARHRCPDACCKFEADDVYIKTALGRFQDRVFFWNF